MGRRGAAGARTGSPSLRNERTGAATGYLRDPGLARALKAARDTVERLGRVGGTAMLVELTPAEADALDGLLGGLRRKRRPTPGESFRLVLADVDAALRLSRFAVGLQEALALVGPPLVLAPQRRAEQRAAFDSVWSDALAHPLARGDAAVREWIEWLRACGVLASLKPAEARERLKAALDLGARLPADPPAELSRIASGALDGDPHALDVGEPLSTLMLGQLAARVGVARPRGAAERRLLWQRFGVVPDAASADVLTLGLAPLSDGPLARSLRLLRGTHFRLTLGQLTREPLTFARNLEVLVCENPTVLLAVESELGMRAPPMVCTAGWPNTAALTLLDRLAEHGATLRSRADYDWRGLMIAALLARNLPVSPWRFGAAHYRSALSKVSASPELDVAPQAVPAGGDRELAAAMSEAGRAIYEESLLTELLADAERIGAAPWRRGMPLGFGAGSDIA